MADWYAGVRLLCVIQQYFENKLTGNVIGVGVVQATRPVAVAGAPGGISVVFLTLMASSDISCEVRAVLLVIFCPCSRRSSLVYLLQDGTLVYISHG